ncbi:MAG: NTP transferase domain-containing protein [Planctomycetaceae bacterium]|nr:NTP transferase domain-containing protein [Planctomycetaceae bacterium]MDC0273588.1 NTP transferase domain-containing protein [Planctomycetaceae bacterium]MDG2388121.1 NTP transferase domain-containing protein [Planctomycetaceae bacterium]
MSEIVAVILAAGKSSRMKSRSSKVLHPLFGRPMIDYVLCSAREAGANRFLIVIGHEGEAVQAALSDEPDLEFVWQHDPQGTGHAVMMCEEHLKSHTGQTLVLSGDTPLLSSDSLRKLLDENQSAACVIGSAITENNYGLGRIVRDDSGAFQKIVEQKDATFDEATITEINTGCYLFETADLLSSLGQIDKSNNQGELYLTDCPAILLNEGKTVVASPCFSIDEAMGVNTREHLADVREVLHQRGLEKLMAAGVGIVNPALVDIDPRATIGQDTIIHPFSLIEGEVTIGENCVVGPHAVIRDTNVGDGTIIPPFTLLTD